MREDGEPPAVRGAVRACLELTKPGITGFVVLSAGVGFLLGAGPGWELEAAHLDGRLLDLALTLLGTALAAGGTNALNQWLERAADARMRRTRDRPLPGDRLSSGAALGFGLLLAAGGPAVLLLVDPVAAALAALTVAVYDLVYTPLKRHTWLATIVGGVPGALPILGGWQAAAGELSAEAWILFALLFLWQLPHFFALDWLLREDYRRGGFRTLATLRPDGGATSVAAVSTTVLLAATSLLPWAAGGLGAGYAAGASALGGGLIALALPVGVSPSDRGARRLFLGTLLYLPAVYALLVTAAGWW
ncbi:MAG: heme o synthase [Candidatus Palauibacterales bacterium]|nr:heme o synthase [Candidatus Palauibacterales bacterium]